MSHDTHNAQPEKNKSIISFKNSFWMVIILVGLFIAALNFVNAESASGEEGKGEAKTEAAPASEKPATEMKAETAKPAETAASAAPVADTAKAK